MKNDDLMLCPIAILNYKGFLEDHKTMIPISATINRVRSNTAMSSPSVDPDCFNSSVDFDNSNAWDCNP